MIVDSLLVPECIVRPGSFVGLMTIYESNYLRLQQLLPDYEQFEEPRFSRSHRDCTLYLNLVERHAYTTTVKLTYLFAEPTGTIADPDLTVRIYHDARLVEAMDSCAEHRHSKLQEIASQHCSELDRRWSRNMMLNKWLDFLIDMGHDLR